MLKGLWGEGPFSFTGDHYTITELDGTPKPLRPADRRSSSAAGLPGCSDWAGAAADIVGVNASIHSGEIDGRPPRTRWRTASTRRSAGSKRARAVASTTSR